MSKPGNWTRWLDTFANTTQRTITVDVTFGGSAGQNTANNQSSCHGARRPATRRSAPPTPGSADQLAERERDSTRGPHAAVIGTQTGSVNFQRDPFGAPLPATGLEANFYAYRNTITLAPGQTKSLLRYVVAGRTETAATDGRAEHRRHDHRDRAGRPRPT